MKWLWIIFFLFSIQCFAQTVDTKRVSVTDINNTRIGFPNLLDSKATIVFVFLSTECPLCQNYSLTLNKLSEKFKTNTSFVGVFAGKDQSVQDIKVFLSTYHVNFKAVRDIDYSLTYLLKAEITPQAIVLNHTGNVLYSGRIDNWAYELGKKRKLITEHELEDALSAISNHREVKVKQTKAVGCLIR